MLDIQQSWKIIDSFLEVHFPTIATTMNPGATYKDIERFSNSLPFDIPEDLKVSLLHHNGQNDPTQLSGLVNFNRLLSIEEMYDTYSVNCEVFEGWEPIDGLIPDKIKNIVWSERWLKFTEREGDGYILDMDPAQNGTDGQIFYRRHDDTPVKTLAKSYRGFLSMIAESFQEGDYEVIDSLPIINFR
jgi:cell wall assembly regulator SMI1